MWKFVRGKGQQPSAERQKLQKELFAFRKTAQHGFPHKPSALAYDPISKLMAIGTNSGVIKVFGQPGVEFYGQHTSTSGNTADLIVQQIEWIPGTGRLLSLTASNQLILWEPAGLLLVPIKQLPFDGKLKKISSLCCSSLKDTVWIGTEGGNVYQFDIQTFSIKEPVIYHDVVFEQLPTNYKLNPGAIECVKQLPTNHNLLLIAYNRGLCVLWDLEKNSVKQSYISPGHGQSVGLYIDPEGDQFTWYHADGSYATWQINSKIPPDNQKYVPYGPDPCKAIDRLTRGYRGPCELVVFAGGMPRSSYGDHHCVSVHCKDGTKIAFDFTSKVIDFFVTFNDDQPDQVEVLIVLLEEELVAYDLTNKTLPQINTPYLHSLHASAITCNHLVSQVSSEVYEKIVEVGRKQIIDYSDKEWPITGGNIPERDPNDSKNEYDILLTGHEDGSVKFWDCSEVYLRPLLHIKTAPLFGNSEDDLESPHNDSTEQLDESEPPFRKAGQFDPYSDDPRLAVKKISLCPKTGVLVIAGTAGNVVLGNFDEQNEDLAPIKAVKMDLVSDRDSFVWKGHGALNLKQRLSEEPAHFDGINFTNLIQIHPPAAITCIALQSKWNLVAAGTAHGLILYDFNSQQPVLRKCTLNPNDLTGAGETLSRRKSFKKTLRESFRRLRKGRSTRNNPNTQAASPTDARPVERQIEARPVDDGMGSMVRCLTFAQTYITNLNAPVATLWSGTNSSCVSIFILNFPQKQNNNNETNDVQQQVRPVTGQLAKEIQLKHRAPVIGISVFDHNGVPAEFHETVGPGPHRVLIASEEQFKIFSLPQLKPVNKYKLTAHEGARVRRIAFATFTCNVKVIPQLSHQQSSPPKASTPSSPQQQSATNETTLNTSGSGSETVTEEFRKYSEIGLLCLTNLGDCLVLSIPELKRQLNAAAVRREDINGISSLCFTNHGEALYMMSSSEVQRITLSASRILTPIGTVDLEPLAEEEEVDEEIAELNENDDSQKQQDQPDEDVEIHGREIVEHSQNQLESHKQKSHEKLTNGVNGEQESSPIKANETISSSIGDITIDSVRDHLNSTTTTLCSTTTEEIVGRLSVLSTNSVNTTSSAKTKDITDQNSSNIKDLKLTGDSTETNQKSVIIKSVITSVKHGTTNNHEQLINGDSTIEKITLPTIKTSTNTFRKESQF
uniref:Lethal(2) giant larvae protein n=1 Tax=Corethrella appendiculata TaxID=1370023 RepID=U5EW29_9DIPT